jgi:hypothetical protein
MVKGQPVAPIFFGSLTLEDGNDRLSPDSVNNYQRNQYNIPEERSFTLTAVEA